MPTSRSAHTRPTLTAISIALASVLAGAGLVSASDEVLETPDVRIVIDAGLSERSIVIDAGDVIEFVNRDSERHRMRARSGPEPFDTGNLEPGESHRIRLTAAASYRYIDERDDDATAYHGLITVRGGDVGGPDATTATIRIGDEIFAPGVVTVAAGGSVTFDNTDGDDHTATSTDGGPILSPVLAPGDTYSVDFPSPGSFAFLCAIHPEMTGVVEVVGEPTTGSAVPVVPPAPPVAPSAPPAGTADGAEVAIEMRDFAFDAADVEIEVGTTVVWTNRGSAPHTATGDAAGFDTAMVASGESARHRFDAAGTYQYLCVFHPDMRGTITVVAATGAAPAPAGAGSAADSNVPVAPSEPSDKDVATTPSEGGPTRTSSPSAAGSGDTLGLARLAFVVAFVTIAAALFARVIEGTVRPARDAD